MSACIYDNLFHGRLLCSHQGQVENFLYRRSAVHTVLLVHRPPGMMPGGEPAPQVQLHLVKIRFAFFISLKCRMPPAIACPSLKTASATSGVILVRLPTVSRASSRMSLSEERI